MNKCPTDEELAEYNINSNELAETKKDLIAFHVLACKLCQYRMSLMSPFEAVEEPTSPSVFPPLTPEQLKRTKEEFEKREKQIKQIQFEKNLDNVKNGR